MKKLLKIFRKAKAAPSISRREVCICGSGGQGIILAGIVFAQAAAIYEGKQVVQTQSYGPEARGGACRSEVIISEQEIDYPKTSSLDALLAMQQEALDKHISKLKKEGVLIMDSLLVKTIPPPKENKNIFSLPFTTMAKNQLGNIVAANMIALGAMAEIAPLAGLDALNQALAAIVKKEFIDLNRKALLLGYQEAKKLREIKNESIRISG